MTQSATIALTLTGSGAGVRQELINLAGLDTLKRDHDMLRDQVQDMHELWRERGGKAPADDVLERQQLWEVLEALNGIANIVEPGELEDRWRELPELLREDFERDAIDFKENVQRADRSEKRLRGLAEWFSAPNLDATPAELEEAIRDNWSNLKADAEGIERSLEREREIRQTADDRLQAIADAFDFHQADPVGLFAHIEAAWARLVESNNQAVNERDEARHLLSVAEETARAAIAGRAATFSERELFAEPDELELSPRPEGLSDRSWHGYTVWRENEMARGVTEGLGLDEYRRRGDAGLIPGFTPLVFEAVAPTYPEISETTGLKIGEAEDRTAPSGKRFKLVRRQHHHFTRGSREQNDLERYAIDTPRDREVGQIALSVAGTWRATVLHYQSPWLPTLDEALAWVYPRDKYFGGTSPAAASRNETSATEEPSDDDRMLTLDETGLMQGAWNRAGYLPIGLMTYLDLRFHTGKVGLKPSQYNAFMADMVAAAEGVPAEAEGLTTEQIKAAIAECEREKREALDLEDIPTLDAIEEDLDGWKLVLARRAEGAVLLEGGGA
jgi:hypothetical protein